MARHSSATTREEASHTNSTTRTATIINALKRRAQAVLNDKSIDPQTRAIIRYSLEINDPWLAKLVRSASAGESIDTFDFSQEPETNEDDPSEAKIEALVEIICQSGDRPAAALLVLMATLESSAHPKVLANTAKHFVFRHCSELNLYGMVDTQTAAIESELFI